MRRNPLTLLFAFQVLLAAARYQEIGALEPFLGWLFFTSMVALAVLGTRDLRRRGVDNAWVFGLLLFFMPFVGFFAYVLVHGRNPLPAASAAPG